jgi:hypothetical protein
MLNAFDEGLEAASHKIRQKYGNTLVKTLRETYGEKFAAGYSGDTNLQTLLDREGFSTFEQYLKHAS